jgi:hypothetical protein
MTLLRTTLTTMPRVTWLVLAIAGFPVALTAQGGEWPTLSGAGIKYLSRSGAVQVSLSGQLDLETIHVRESWAGLIARENGEAPLPANREACAVCHVDMGVRGDGGALQSYRLRMFADIFLGDHVYSLIEGRSDRGHAPSDGGAVARIEQAYIRIATQQGAAAVQVGRFASPFGSYPLRHLTTVDPFLRPPLLYDYRTLMSREVVPDAAPSHRLLRWKQKTEFFRKPGTPPVWDVPYQWGAMVFGAVGPLDLRVAAMNSAPSSDPEAWGFDSDRLEDPSWMFAARTRLSPDLDVGVSYNKGPWMEEFTAGTIDPLPDAPAGSDPPSFKDFDQEIVSVDATFSRGSMMLRAEAMLDRWDVPNWTERPTERLYSVKLQWDLMPGVFVAGRLGHIDFRPLDDGLDDASPTGPTDWDNDVTGYEASVGYRLVRNAGVILSAYEQVQSQEIDTDSRFAGIRL